MLCFNGLQVHQTLSRLDVVAAFGGDVNALCVAAIALHKAHPPADVVARSGVRLFPYIVVNSGIFSRSALKHL